MKILLDENIDVRLKFPLSQVHEVYTVKEMNWNGIKNGELLILLAQHDFDCWIVADKNIPYQQNISRLPCLVIVLNVFRNTLAHLQALLPKVFDVLRKSTSEKIIIIEED